MAELASEMGIFKPSLYATFGSKAALFQSALELYAREHLAFVADAFEAPTARMVAKRLLRGTLEMQTDPLNPKGCLSLSSVRGSETIRADLAERRATFADRLTLKLESACTAADLPRRHASRALAYYLIALMHGISMQASAGASRRDLESLVDVALLTWPYQ